jgi:hypothetical protein
MDTHGDQALESALTRQLYRMHCPDPQVLGDYHLGVLQAGREEVEAHVRECPRCQEELEGLERFLRIRDRPDVRVLLAQWLPALRVAEPAPAYALRGSVQLSSATLPGGGVHRGRVHHPGSHGPVPADSGGDRVVRGRA